MFQTDAESFEKQKSFIPKKKKKAVVSKYAKRDPKDGVCCTIFSEGFGYCNQLLWSKIQIQFKESVLRSPPAVFRPQTTRKRKCYCSLT